MERIKIDGYDDRRLIAGILADYGYEVRIIVDNSNYKKKHYIEFDDSKKEEEE